VATLQRSIENDALEIAFDESGRGRPVVWLHGINEDRHSWTPVTEQLADEMRCVRIDFRGHGASSRCRSYELEALVSDVTSVISAIGTDPPIVVGHSLGGLVATIAATMGITGPVICVDQPLNLEGFAEVVHPLAARLRDPATYPDALMEEKLALGMGLVPEPIFGELERKTRTSDHNVVLDIWKPMLDWDLGAMDAAKSILERSWTNSLPNRSQRRHHCRHESRRPQSFSPSAVSKPERPCSLDESSRRRAARSPAQREPRAQNDTALGPLGAHIAGVLCADDHERTCADRCGPTFDRRGVLCSKSQRADGSYGAVSAAFRSM
jgi:pimeloyl-ACP methyl ester carboxylesterase